jgi:hypothetical protein
MGAALRSDPLASGSDPGYNNLVANHLKAVFKDRAFYDAFKISGLGPVQKLRHIHAHDGRWDQTEIGKDGVAAADVRPAEENAPKSIPFGNLLQLATQRNGTPAARARSIISTAS